MIGLQVFVCGAISVILAAKDTKLERSHLYPIAGMALFATVASVIVEIYIIKQAHARVQLYDETTEKAADAMYKDDFDTAETQLAAVIPVSDIDNYQFYQNAVAAIAEAESQQRPTRVV